MYYDLKESGKRIATLRKAKGYTQAELSELVGVSQQTIGAVEIGLRATSIDTFVALADVLDTSLDYIIVGRETNAEVDKLLNGLNEEKKVLAFKILKGILENI